MNAPFMETAAGAVVGILLNSLWEAAVLALAVWLVLRFAKNLNASTRCVAWSFTLVAAIVLPIATTLPQLATSNPVVPSSPDRAALVQRLHATTATDASAKSSTAHASVALQKTASPSSGSPLPARLRLSVPALLVAILLAIWVLGAIAFLVPLIVSLYALERLKRDALPLPVAHRDALRRWNQAPKGSRDVRICITDKTDVPIAIGLFDSMILIPEHLLDALSGNDIDQIALHELAHLRRGDDYINALQRLVQAIFFFNPAMRWIAQQLDLEREVACDDWVLSLTGDVRPYAFCLTKLAEMTAWPHRPLAAPGAFASRKSISVRVERLLRAGRDVRPSISLTFAGCVTAAFVAVFFVLQSVAPSFAFEAPRVPETIAPPPPALPKFPRVPDAAPRVHVVTKVEERVVLVNSGGAHGLTAVPPIARPMPELPTPSRAALPPHEPRIVVAVDAPTAAGPEVSSLAEAGIAKAAAAVASGAAMTNELARAIAPEIQLDRTSMKTVSVEIAQDAPTAEGSACRNCNLSGVNWAGKDLRGRSFMGADLSRADLQGANLSNARLVGVNFSGANLRDVNFTGAKLSGCNFSGADLSGAKLSKVALAGNDLRHANLSRADLSGAAIAAVDFSDANLRGANVAGATFAEAAFNGTDLRDVDFSQARLIDSSVSNAIVR